MTGAARPLIYGDEKLDQAKKINFTLSQVAEIQEKCGPQTDFGSFVREAALAAVRGELPDQSPKLRTVPAAKSADIKAAVLEALKEHHAPDTGSHVIELTPDLNKKLEEVSESIGFNDPADFIQEVLRTLLRDPEEMRELVIGKTIRDLETVIGKLSEETPKRSRKVA